MSDHAFIEALGENDKPSLECVLSVCKACITQYN